MFIIPYVKPEPEEEVSEPEEDFNNAFNLEGMDVEFEIP